jgi:Tol biopolymer transport system component/DNA-binding winged helix-turn-helix (wHTH) protein
MSAGPKLAPIHQFGPYVFDVSAGQLFKRGYKLKIAGQPLQVLAMLLERPHQVVTREEIRERLWSEGTFVDFENGLNKAINKLRQALNDSAEKPVYIETLPRKGYRFTAQVGSGQGFSRTDRSRHQPESPIKLLYPSPLPVPQDRLRPISQPGPVNRALSRRYLIPAIAAIILAGSLTQWLSQARAPRVLRMTQLTSSGRAEHWAWINSDGSRVYFNERHGSRWPLMQTSVSGGESLPVAAPFTDTIIFSISPDHSEMLVGSFTSMTGNLPLSIMRAQGGALQRVGDVLVDRAAWFPDEKRILFVRGSEVFSMDRDGTHQQKLFSVAGTPYGFSWRPDGSSFRFTVNDASGRDSLWEANADGTKVHPLLRGWQGGSSPCCGAWMPDGRNYVFSAYEGNRRDIWVLRATSGLRFRQDQPIQITFGPNQFAIPLPTQDGRKLLVFGSQPRSTLMRFDLDQQQFVPYLGGISAIDIAFSRDGQWVTYIAWPELVLWRSRLDGSERVQLTPPQMRALRPRWSPDGKQILFAGQVSDGDYSAYIVDSYGGMPRPVLKHDSVTRVLPEWSPDGHSVLLDSNSLPDQPIFTLDLKSGSQIEIPGSRGISAPRWSGDGRYLAARSSNERKLMLFNVLTQRWSELRSSKAISRYEWDKSGRYLYFQEILDPQETVSRFDTRTGVTTRIFDFAKPLQAGAMRCGFEGLSPDGQLLGSIRTGWADIYVLDVDLP